MFGSRKTVAVLITALWASSLPAQTQTDPQSGAQLGEQSALAGRQAQGANTEKATASASPAGASLATGTAINAELTGSVDSKKAKPGDAVNARTTDAALAGGKIVIPRGTKLAGHVTKASARGAGQTESSLGLVFDKAILKNGQEMPLSVAIQALAAPQAAADLNQNSDVTPMGGMSPAAGGGAASGVGSTAGGVAGGATRTVNNTAGGAGGAVDSTINSTAGVAGAANTTAASGLNGAERLDSSTRGVIGLKNLSLHAAGENSTQGSVITSTGKNVRLDSGTQMMLVTQPATAGQPATDRENGASEKRPDQKP